MENRERNTEKETCMERMIDQTRYIVRFHFDPQAKENAEEIVKRLIREECAK